VVRRRLLQEVEAVAVRGQLGMQQPLAQLGEQRVRGVAEVEYAVGVQQLLRNTARNQDENIVSQANVTTAVGSASLRHPQPLGPARRTELHTWGVK
jgi:hypothetical protein